MPLESGFERGTPSMTTDPASGATKPAMMFISVVLPQPDGPTIATNSPSRTLKLTSATTGRRPWSDAKLFCTERTSILVRIAPPDPADCLQHAHEPVERQPDQADDDHASDDQVVAVTGIARIHDHVAE